MNTIFIVSEYVLLLFKRAYLLLTLVILVSCKKENTDSPLPDMDPPIIMDKYFLKKTHIDWVNGQTTTTTTNVTMYIAPIGKDSIVNFNGGALSFCVYLQPDSTCWYFTIDGLYPGSPYNGTLLSYFPANDSIKYSNWYGGSHTYSHSDEYTGKKAD